MTLKTSDLIVYPSRATVADALDALHAHLGYVPDGATPFLNALYWYATRKGIDFAVIASHAANECNMFRDDRFQKKRDGFGIAVYGDGSPGASFKTYDDAAFYAVAEYCLKLGIELTEEEEQRALSINPQKWGRVYRLTMRSDFPKVTRISQMNTRFGDNDCWWMCDPNGPAAIVEKSKILFPNIPDQQPTTGGPTDMATKPYILLVAGHRSYNDAGNPAEKDLTDDLARIYTAAFRSAGYRADWWQRDLDKDSDPDDTVGGLDTVALGCANVLAGISGPKVLLDLHFNGATSPVHAIVPDSRGLTTAYANGSPSDDAYANNTLDRAFAARWAQGVANAFGLALYQGKASEPGVMLEGETGVGLDGYRLATMAASARVRADTIRCVLEHAGTAQWGSGGDREARFTRCAQIAVGAIGAVYGVDGDTPTPTTTPAPEPGPTYAKASIPAWWSAVKKAAFPANQTFDDAKKTRFFALRTQAVVVRPTIQRATASTDNEKATGPDLGKGVVVNVQGFYKVGATKWAMVSGSGDIADGARIPLRDLSLNLTFSERAA
jgi:hypothetical protein